MANNFLNLMQGGKAEVPESQKSDPYKDVENALAKLIQRSQEHLTLEEQMLVRSKNAKAEQITTRFLKSIFGEL